MFGIRNDVISDIKILVSFWCEKDILCLVSKHFVFGIRNDILF